MEDIDLITKRIETDIQYLNRGYDPYYHWSKRGYVKLGGGAYSTVFSHPEFYDYAIKVVASDPGYDAFLDIINHFGESEHFPRIYNRFTVGSKHNKKTVTVMEKLRGLSDEDYVIDGRTIENIWYRIKDREINDIDMDNSFIFCLACVIEEARKRHTLAFNDIHQGNFMMRYSPEGKKTLVIIDPFAG